ncbi:UNC-like C-terminal-domain-containing protein [Chytriomyces sp. MP71]|nr:UNC-like C-terminal-domain-containing protein [Chytriomyces sp. MP71]
MWAMIKGTVFVAQKTTRVAKMDATPRRTKRRDTPSVDTPTSSSAAVIGEWNAVLANTGGHMRRWTRSSASSSVTSSVAGDAVPATAAVELTPKKRTTRRPQIVAVGSPAASAIRHRRRPGHQLSEFVGALFSDADDGSDRADADSDATSYEDEDADTEYTPRFNSDDDELEEKENLPDMELPPRSPWKRLVSSISSLSPSRLLFNREKDKAKNQEEEDEEGNEQDELDHSDGQNGGQEEPEDEESSDDEEFEVELDYGDQQLQTSFDLNSSPGQVSASGLASALKYLPSAPPKWNDLVPDGLPAFMDEDYVAPLRDWYNIMIVDNAHRIANLRVYIPPIFPTGDGDESQHRPQRHWNLFFPLRPASPPSDGSLATMWGRISRELEVWREGLGSRARAAISASAPLRGHGTPTMGDGGGAAGGVDAGIVLRIQELERAIGRLQSALVTGSRSVEGVSKALVENKKAVEKAHSLIDALTKNVNSQGASSSEAQTELKESIGILKDTLEAMRSEISLVAKESREQAFQVERRFENVEVEVGAVQDDLARVGSSVTHLEGEYKTVHDNVNGLRDGLKGVHGRVENLAGGLKAMDERVGGLANNVKSASDKLSNYIAKLNDQILALIHDNVPSMMVVRRGKDGDLIMDPAFLAQLKEKFVSTEEKEVSEAKFKNMIAEKLTEATKGLASHSDVRDVVTKIVGDLAIPDDLEARLQSLVSATNDLKIHVDKSVKKEIEAAVKSLASLSHVEESLLAKTKEFKKNAKDFVNEVLAGGKDTEESKAILTREQVMELVKAELAKTTEELQANFDEKLVAVSAQEKAKLDMETMKSVMNKLISTALSKYSADGIGREDYALETNGAYVIEGLTSAPFTVPSKSSFGKLMGFRQRHGWGPFIAINEGALPTKCWAMEGTSGTLGIRLASPVIPSAFTIDHVNKDLVVNPNGTGLKSAPKEVELWAVLGDNLASFARLDLDDPKSRTLPKSAEKSRVPAGILLAQKTFDPHLGSVQTFPTDTEAVKYLEKIGFVPSAVVFRIASNWGNTQYTCLYRVRVHGRK